MALTDSLVSYWKFDENSSGANAADVTATGNTLTNQNTTGYTTGKLGASAANIVAASSNGFQIADASQTGLDITGDFSVSFWVKHASLPPTNGSADQYYIDKRRVSGGFGQYSMGYVGTGSIRALHLGQIRDSSNNISEFTMTNNVDLSTVAFQHIVFVFTAATPAATVYIDNSSQAMTTNSSAATSIGNNDGPFTVGYAITPGTVNLNAVFDECGIWSRALSSTEVSQLYNGGAGLAYPFAATGNSNFFMFMPN